MDDETLPQRIKRRFYKLFGAFSPVVLVVLGLLLGTRGRRATAAGRAASLSS